MKTVILCQKKLPSAHFKLLRQQDVFRNGTMQQFFARSKARIFVKNEATYCAFQFPQNTENLQILDQQTFFFRQKKTVFGWKRDYLLRILIYAKDRKSSECDYEMFFLSWKECFLIFFCKKRGYLMRISIYTEDRKSSEM